MSCYNGFIFHCNDDNRTKITIFRVAFKLLTCILSEGCIPNVKGNVLFQTNLGTFICDIMVAATNADFALLNSGTLRSDMIHPAGPFFLKDLLLILPMIDPIVLLELTGNNLKFVYSAMA